MRWYAETGGRRLREVTTDLAVAAWALLWWQVATTTRELVAALGAPGRSLARTGDRLGGAFDDVAGAVDGAPLVGDLLGAPFVEAAEAATAVGAVGRAQEAAALQLGTWIGVLLFVVPVGLVAAVWLTARLRTARRRGQAARLRDDAHGSELLALRSLVRRPVTELLGVTATPVADWRAGRTDELAALELRGVGLRGAR